MNVRAINQVGAMNQEIERKFLVKGEVWRSLGPPKHYRQGYIYTDDSTVVSVVANDVVIADERLMVNSPDLALFQSQDGQIHSQAGNTIRIRIAGTTGYLTFKTKTVGISRNELEVEIPLDQATRLLDQVCQQPQIEKYRYRIEIGDLVWEVDDFQGENRGLILAEVELQDENQIVTIPDWIGEEVTGDRRYYNSKLAKHPFSRW
jgi:adenylate cyclase